MLGLAPSTCCRAPTRGTSISRPKGPCTTLPDVSAFPYRRPPGPLRETAGSFEALSLLGIEHVRSMSERKASLATTLIFWYCFGIMDVKGILQKYKRVEHLDIIEFLRKHEIARGALLVSYTHDNSRCLSKDSYYRLAAIRKRKSKQGTQVSNNPLPVPLATSRRPASTLPQAKSYNSSSDVLLLPTYRDTPPHRISSRSAPRRLVKRSSQWL
jgi:hypothetical protein